MGQPVKHEESNASGCTVKGFGVAFLQSFVRWEGISVGMRQPNPVTQQGARDGSHKRQKRLDLWLLSE
jgi:hypothetical protein